MQLFRNFFEQSIFKGSFSLMNYKLEGALIYFTKERSQGLDRDIANNPVPVKP